MHPAQVPYKPESKLTVGLPNLFGATLLIYYACSWKKSSTYHNLSLESMDNLAEEEIMEDIMADLRRKERLAGK